MRAGQRPCRDALAASRVQTRLRAEPGSRAPEGLPPPPPSPPLPPPPWLDSSLVGAGAAATSGHACTSSFSRPVFDCRRLGSGSISPPSPLRRLLLLLPSPGLTASLARSPLLRLGVGVGVSSAVAAALSMSCRMERLTPTPDMPLILQADPRRPPDQSALSSPGFPPAGLKSTRLLSPFRGRPAEPS